MSSAGQGVYFRTADYASFWRRLFADMVDLAVAGTICVAFVILVETMVPFTSLDPRLALGSLAGIIFVYFTILKRSKLGTAGYRWSGIKVVGPDGLAPGLPALAIRFGFSTLGPLNWFLDLGWLAGDPHKQALRDKLAHTYVVRRTAQPEGNGKIVYRYYEICFLNCLFQEIESSGQNVGDANRLPADRN